MLHVCFQIDPDITVESGQYQPDSLLDLAIARLTEVADRQPSVNKASHLMAKVTINTNHRQKIESKLFHVFSVGFKRRMEVHKMFTCSYRQ